MKHAMNSMQRTLTSLSHQEPDRVPLFLLTSLHGAKELGVSIQEYFAKPAHVVEGQMRLLKKYHSDCLYTFHHASLEMEAWGSTSIFALDGPPLCGAPIIASWQDIDRLEAPDVLQAEGLKRVLSTTSELKARVGDSVPIIGVVMSPFSLPVMQMGFDKYIELMDEQPGRFDRLMQVNEEFTVAWANAQLAAGATAICYFDPVASPTIVPRASYLKLGQPVTKRTLGRIKGPTATHLASARTQSILGDIADTGTAVVGVSAMENLSDLKRVAAGRVSLLGNLNGVEMRRWTPDSAQLEVKRAIARAGRGGGFILSDNHGEIPWQVPEDVLLAISDAVERWGRYPLAWIDDWNDPAPV